MKVVIQRVKRAQLTVDGRVVAKIGEGLVCYLGVGKGDTDDDRRWLVKKLAGLRIFADQAGKMNLSLLDCGFAALVVSQFTLFGSVKKGFRPSFTSAEEPEAARQGYELFCQELLASGVKEVATGIFAADMQIEQVNDGPVTIVLDSRQE